MNLMGFYLPVSRMIAKISISPLCVLFISCSASIRRHVRRLLTFIPARKLIREFGIFSPYCLISFVNGPALITRRARFENMNKVKPDPRSWSVWLGQSQNCPFQDMIRKQ